MTFERREGYGRAVVAFGAGGGTASSVPVWSLSSPEGEGYARITFPEVEATLDTDGEFGGTILDNFYVVRAPGGGLFVDLYATGAFQYRVAELSDPGRLVVDYRPAGADLSCPIPAQAERTVVFEPRTGEAVTSPLTVSGYSRNPEALNTIALVDASGNILAQSTALSNDWLDTWLGVLSRRSWSFRPSRARRPCGSVARARETGVRGGRGAPVTYGGDGG